ncbi:MAG: response regulator [candidate division KSB1 bacterium]|nr:response regulator [candidate division KSB1 bacterium]MDZ7342537.1 response regulator [candidate division KSB1 bacterium]
MNHLLVVEDDASTLAGLMELLAEEGYNVNGTMQGNDALEIAARNPIDMVLCDYNLPDVDGLRVCQRLRKLNPAVILFLTTASDNTALVDTARKVGISKIFHKPINLDDLFKTLLGYASKSA